MSGQLATGCWPLAREEAWKVFLRRRLVLRAPANRSLLASHWQAARVDVRLIRQQPTAGQRSEALA